MSLLTKAWNSIPATYRLILAVAIALCVILIIWFYGMHLWNWADKTIYNWRISAAQKELDKKDAQIQASEQRFNNAEKVLAEALRKLKQAEEETARKTHEHELALSFLADKSKNTDAKLKAYYEALQRPSPVSPVGSTDELCLRAKAFGISCEP